MSTQLVTQVMSTHSARRPTRASPAIGHTGYEQSFGNGHTGYEQPLDHTGYEHPPDHRLRGGRLRSEACLGLATTWSHRL